MHDALAVNPGLQVTWREPFGRLGIPPEDWLCQEVWSSSSTWDPELPGPQGWGAPPLGSVAGGWMDGKSSPPGSRGRGGESLPFGVQQTWASTLAHLPPTVWLWPTSSTSHSRSFLPEPSCTLLTGLGPDLPHCSGWKQQGQESELGFGGTGLGVSLFDFQGVTEPLQASLPPLYNSKMTVLPRTVVRGMEVKRAGHPAPGTKYPPQRIITVILWRSPPVASSVKWGDNSLFFRMLGSPVRGTRLHIWEILEKWQFPLLPLKCP